MSKPPNEEEKGLTTQPTVGSTPPTVSHNSGIDPTLLKQFLIVAEREAEARLEEINVEKQGRADAHEYAKLALNAQADDRKDLRSHSKSERRDRMYFAGLMMLALVAFIITLIPPKSS